MSKTTLKQILVQGHNLRLLDEATPAAPGTRKPGQQHKLNQPRRRGSVLNMRHGHCTCGFLSNLGFLCASIATHLFPGSWPKFGMKLLSVQQRGFFCIGNMPKGYGMNMRQNMLGSQNLPKYCTMLASPPSKCRENVIAPKPPYLENCHSVGKRCER